MSTEGFPAYTVVRSRRKTIALQVNEAGKLTVRAPRECKQKEIDAVLARNQK